MRARLEAHRANPTCKGCHGLIDPPGLALENFDVTGRGARRRPAKQPIDATRDDVERGSLCTARRTCADYLNSRADQFPTTVTKRLMMYALNREVEYYDMPQVRQIVRTAAANNYTFASIITGVVNSEPSAARAPEVALEKKPTTPATKVASKSTGGAGAHRSRIQER